MNQEVVTPIRVVTGDCDPVYGGCRVWLYVFPHRLQKKTCSHGRFLPRSLGHQQFRCVVTQSPAFYQCGHMVSHSPEYKYWSDHPL